MTWTNSEHKLRHTYATEMLHAGVSFPALMKLLGHTSPDMTMLYVEVSLNDLQREFQQARLKPRHLVPQPKAYFAHFRTGRDGVADSVLAAQHALEMFRRSLAVGPIRRCLDRLSNRLTKIAADARKLPTPGEWAEIGRLSRPSGSDAIDSDQSSFPQLTSR
jgi:Phage integrase family